MVKRFSWNRCAMLSSTDNVFLISAGAWSQRLEDDNVTVAPFKTFGVGAFDGAALVEVQKAAVRVVIVLACSSDNAAIAVAAQRTGMMAAGWAWVGMDTVPAAEETVGAELVADAKRALDGWLYLSAQSSSAALATFYRDVQAYGER